MADAGVTDNTVADNQDDSAGPASITLGETPGQLVATLGSPKSIVDLGFRKIYVYNDMKVTFIAGRLSDVR
jgi:hypothetical protein